MKATQDPEAGGGSPAAIGGAHPLQRPVPVIKVQAATADPAIAAEAARREAALEHDAARIEELLAQIERMAGPSTWQGVEELVERLVRLYGAGLQRTLAYARETGADEARLAASLGADELVSSLLLLHGIHPLPVEVRVERALERVRPVLGTHAGGVEFLGVNAGGVVGLRLLGACQGCPSSRATVEGTLRRAIEEAAPEIAGIDWGEGTGAPSPPMKLPILDGPSVGAGRAAGHSFVSVSESQSVDTSAGGREASRGGPPAAGSRETSSGWSASNGGSR